MTNTKNIMIVDDEPISTKVLEKYLTNEGYEVTYFHSAIKGIEELKKIFYPMVITDISMPDMGGLAFLKWINENTPKTDVILMTGFGTQQIKEAARQRGAVNFFEKPVDLKKLAQFIKYKFNNQHFTGNITELSLSEFIQMFLVSNKKRRIVIHDAQTNEEGVIYVFEGNIVEAKIGDLTGEEAFYQITLLSNGSFRDEEWEQPDLFTINKSVQYLFSEAAKRRNNRKIHLIDTNNKDISKVKSNKKILVVDDDQLTRLIIEKYLKQHGYNVITVSSALEGLQLLTQQHFDLVLTDINMPELNGIEFMLWIRTNFSKVKVIVMTAFSSESLKNVVSKNGAVAYLEKPLDLQELDAYIFQQVIENNFSGYVRDIALLDYIKILSFGKSTRKVYINDVVISANAYIYIKDGNIIHAEYDNVSGEEAFYKILKMEYGIFSDVEWEEPNHISINQPFDKLIVEGEIINKGEEINKKLRVKEEIKKAEFIPKVQEEIKKAKYDLVIDDKKMGVFGLYIGKSTKEDFINLISSHSNSDIQSQINNQLITLDDISLNVLFNENNIIEEFNFGELFKGSTYSGLSIGDSIQDAIKIYGKPITGTIKGAVWKHLACFSKQGDNITSMRLRGANFFDNTSTSETKLSDSEKKVLEMVRNKTYTEIVPNLDYTINENNAMEIYVGKTSREQVKEIMLKYSNGFNDIRSNSTKYIYDDISVIINFDSEGIVNELSFGLLYKGKTDKSLAIGDSLESAIKIYGEPKLKNINNSIWNKLSVFCDKANIIESIRIKI
ncbi:MAG: response regulator [Candidatus Sericytochromatia bacterium]